MEVKQLTLCVIVKNHQILLGMKKRGFGKGNWNGFGGKVQNGETVKQAAIRECKEEAGIDVIDVKSRGNLIFTFEEDVLALFVHVFIATAFSGDPKETEEMKPEWFSFEKIPYSQMWPDDIHWLPNILSGKRIRGRFHLRNHSHLLQFEVENV